MEHERFEVEDINVPFADDERLAIEEFNDDEIITGQNDKTEMNGNLGPSDKCQGNAGPRLAVLDECELSDDSSVGSRESLVHGELYEHNEFESFIDELEFASDDNNENGVKAENGHRDKPIDKSNIENSVKQNAESNEHLIIKKDSNINNDLNVITDPNTLDCPVMNDDLNLKDKANINESENEDVNENVTRVHSIILEDEEVCEYFESSISDCWDYMNGNTKVDKLESLTSNVTVDKERGFGNEGSLDIGTQNSFNITSRPESLCSTYRHHDMFNTALEVPTSDITKHHIWSITPQPLQYQAVQQCLSSMTYIKEHSEMKKSKIDLPPSTNIPNNGDLLKSDFRQSHKQTDKTKMVSGLSVCQHNEKQYFTPQQLYQSTEGAPHNRSMNPQCEVDSLDSSHSSHKRSSSIYSQLYSNDLFDSSSSDETSGDENEDYFELLPEKAVKELGEQTDSNCVKNKRAKDSNSQQTKQNDVRHFTVDYSSTFLSPKIAHKHSGIFEKNTNYSSSLRSNKELRPLHVECESGTTLSSLKPLGYIIAPIKQHKGNNSDRDNYTLKKDDHVNHKDATTNQATNKMCIMTENHEKCLMDGCNRRINPDTGRTSTANKETNIDQNEKVIYSVRSECHKDISVNNTTIECNDSKSENTMDYQDTQMNISDTHRSTDIVAPICQPEEISIGPKSPVAKRHGTKTPGTQSPGTMSPGKVSLSSSSHSLGKLSWKDFFGSSVDLADGILGTFDKLSSNQNATSQSHDQDRKTNNQTLGDKMECNHSNEDSNGDQVVPSMKEDFAHNELLPPHIYDNKKRPLSISSTSSSSSSTSSLPRQLRKKLASHVEVSGSLEGGVRPLGAYIRHGVQDFPMDTLTDEEHCSELNDSELTTDQSTLSVTTPEKVDLKDGLVSSKRKGSIHSLLNEPVDANKLYIERVVEEILFTERTYVRDLLEIIEGYYAYILDTPELDITQEDICSLFSNIEDIYRFNSTFLEGLERCGNDPVRIAECFVSQNEGFPIYTHYCTNYPDAVAILTKYMQVRSTAEVFKQRQMALKHGLPLGSYLLKPVQRILKYHLLLQNIVKRYDQDAPGYDTLVEALASMTCVSQHINEMKRKHEHAVHVQEIQSMLYGWEGEDLTTYGELLLEDTFRMCGAKAFRHVFLFEKTLLITKKREEGMLSCKAAILCSNLMLVESIPKEPLSFHIIPFDSPKSQYTLQAKSLEQKRRWCQEVKKAILESFKSKIPEKARELVMTLGHSKDEEAELENKDPSRKQHHAPEYLEKRKSRRKSEFSLLKSQRSSPRGKKGFTRKLSVPNFASKYSPKNSPSTARKQNSKENSPVSEDTLKEEEENAQTEVREPGLIERRSRSMESICDSKDSGQGSGESSHRQSLYDSADAGCYDDACPRAHRISQLLNNEGLERQLSSKDSLVSWDKELVSSVLNVPNIKRAESYKMAAKLNRVDSKIIRAQIQKRLSSTDNAQTETEMEIDDDLYEIVTVKRLDDGYVNIEYKNEGSENEESPYANVILRQSKTNLLYDDNEKDYIVVHTDDLKSSPNSTPTNNEKTPKSENSTAKHSTPNSAINDEGIYDNIHRPYDNIHFNMSYEEPALSNSRPLISPIDMKALDEVFKPLQSPPGTLKAVTKPVAFRPDSPDKVLHLTRSMSSGDTDDPWIPRESDNIPRSRSDNTEFDRLEKYFLETSLSAKPRRHSRARHHRQVSDTTEMFSNNSGLLSPKPGRRDFRYCTPPRTLEADFKAAMSGDKKCEQNIMQRYGTPPREIPEPGRLPHSVSVEPACSVENPKKLPSRSKSFPSRPRRSQSETAMWKDIEDYSLSATEHSNPLPKFPVSNDKPTRPSSMYSPVSSNSTSPQASNTSPSHSASSESIVGSFKTAMAQLTSKLKGRRPLSPHAISTASSSLESSPSHNIHTPESIEEEGEFTEGSTQSSPKKYYVYKLARQYSKKLRSEVKMIEKRINGHGGNSNGASGGKFKKDKQLLSLLKDPGSVSIGARMAETKPIVLGTTYSLPRQRPPRPRKDIKSTDIEANKSDTSSHEGTPERHFEHKIDDDNALLAAYGLADNSASDSMGNESDASFYEKQLTDVLERSVDTTLNGGISHDQNTPIKSNATNENVSHDSAVYSDNDTDHQDSLIKSTIKDTVKNIEEKYRNRPIRKADTHKRARTPGIEEKLQALKEHAEGNIAKTDIDDLPQTTSVRDRKIELIRNYQIGDSVNRVERYRSRTPSSGTGTPGSPYFDMSGSQSEDDALRSVHVRDVIHKFQNETSESES